MAAILSIVLIGMVAFSVDIGYVLSAKEELQRSADASALAACWEYGQKLADGNSSTNAAQLARLTAVQYGTLNKVTNSGMTVDPNTSNNAEGDVVFGYISDFSNANSAFQTSDPNLYNAVRVRMHKQESADGRAGAPLDGDRRNDSQRPRLSHSDRWQQCRNPALCPRHQYLERPDQRQ
jgi:uncharacterized membrane protein